MKTKYKNIYFRDIICAQWALFFDKLGLTWKYEPKKFKLLDGDYVIDFYVEDFGGGGYFEVTTETIDAKLLVVKEQLNAIEQIAEKEKENVFILNGAPDWKYYKKYNWDEHNWCSVMFCGGDHNNMNQSGYYVDPFDSEIEQMWTVPYSVNFWDKYTDAVTIATKYDFYTPHKEILKKPFG